MSITALPTPPNFANSPAEFAAAGDALLGALPQFVSETNATAETINAQATATASNAALAAARAASASAAPATASSSTTNVTIGTGTKNFTIQAGKNLVVGMFVTIAYNASNYMYGNVISYTGTALSVNVTAVVGAGTYAVWAIALSAPVTPLNNSVSGSFSADWFMGSGSGLTGIPFSGLAAQPVQQGGGISQGSNKIYLGWSVNGLKATVDTTDQGAVCFDTAVGSRGVLNNWRDIDEVLPGIYSIVNTATNTPVGIPSSRYYKVWVGTYGAGIGIAVDAETGKAYGFRKSNNVFNVSEWAETIKGIFTPFNAGTTTAGSGTYTNQTGKHTKIANLCFCRGRLIWSAHSGAAGAWRIGGLPFTAVGDQSFALGYVNSVVFGAGKRPVAFIGNGQNYMDIYLQDNTTSTVSQLSVPPAGDIAFEFFYEC